ncbi:hypothetical protein V8C44DRAFT_320531 [Trichoderma aethiopicum]
MRRIGGVLNCVEALACLVSFSWALSVQRSDELEETRMQTRRKQVSKRGVDALVREPERLGIVSKGWDDGRGLGGVVGLRSIKD